MVQPDADSEHPITRRPHLSRLVEEAAGGEEIVIAKRNRPVARLVALEVSERPRKPGGWEGKVWMADDFDAPLSWDEFACSEEGTDQ